MASSGQPLPPPSGYQTNAGHPHPPPPPPPPPQSIMQPAPPPQGYMQPPPPQQIQVSYYPPGQYQNTGQQYRPGPMTHQVSYPAQHAAHTGLSQPMPQPTQQSGLQPMMPSQQPQYQGMMGVPQQPQNQALIPSQRQGLQGQMTGLMVQYPQMPSYQVPVATEPQQVVQHQQQYQPQVMVPVSQSLQTVQGVQGHMPSQGMPLYYSVITPTQQNSTSPSVGYLQPNSEQYQMSQSTSPCNSQQMQQQYSDNYPDAEQSPGFANPVPSPFPFWKCEQCLSRPQLSLLAVTVFPGRPRAHARYEVIHSSSVYCMHAQKVCKLAFLVFCRDVIKGDGRYSLLGQPLQYSLCPPLMHSQTNYSSHQSQVGMKHGARGKRQTLKSQSTDLGTTDVVVSRVLEVTDLPEGISRPDAEKLFNQLSMCGAKIQWLKDPAAGGRGGYGGPGAHHSSGAGMGGGGGKTDGPGNDPAHLYTVVAIFPSTMAAQSASFKLNNSGASHFKLRAAKKNYDLRVLERASSQ
ncbi:hypothetical protein UPYG_G00177370 [Umbra pygmaea]|uniref:R3H domain-containing protein 2 n=1 Tax=Umbra pygmaea TaxID=75934 RepID=A0ABD0X6T7_UMBPY